MWLPLLSISLTAAICFGVASFIMGQEKPRTGLLLRMLDLSQCGPCHPIHIEYHHCRTN